MAHALDRHLALVGFMGAGKSTLGAQVAERLGRRFVDLDRELEQIAAADDLAGLRRARRGGVPRARGRGRARDACRRAAGGGRARRRRGRDRVDPARAAGARADRVTSRSTLRPPGRVSAGETGRSRRRRRASMRCTSARSPLYAEAPTRSRATWTGSCSRPRGSTSRQGLLARLRRAGRGRGRGDRGRDRARSAPAAARGAGPRAARRRGGEEPRRGRAALARAAARPRRHDRRVRRRLHDRRGGLRGRDVPARRSVGRRADDARRPGRRGDRRQDGGQPARGQEPRRRLPLAACGRRSTRRCSRRCPRASVAPGWPRS